MGKEGSLWVRGITVGKEGSLWVRGITVGKGDHCKGITVGKGRMQKYKKACPLAVGPYKRCSHCGNQHGSPSRS